MPSKFRGELGASFVMTKGIDKCLFVFPMNEWQKLEEKIKSLPLTDRNARKAMRYFLGGAAECGPDKQGRINIPLPLREYAGLKKDVVIMGLSTRIEIWDSDEWAMYDINEYSDDEAVLSSMEGLGI